MENGANPLVSVCVTFLNSEQFVGRIIESCLNQTYRNIQVVLVDDASTDKSGEIIAGYAAKDSRVKYHRNPEKVGLTKSVQQTFELADGEYVIWLGVDDWLAQDAIERGVRNFIQHPDAGAVIPRVISLKQVNPAKYEFIGDDSVPAGTYSTEWIAKRAYRGFSSAICLFAMFRKKDALSAVEYFLQNCCYNPAFPEELRNLALKKAYAPDFVFFLEIMTRYKKFVSDDSFATIKIAHSSNLVFDDLTRITASQTLKSEHYRLIFFTPIYQQKYPAFYRWMKIHTRAHSLSEVFICFLRSGLRPSFFDSKENKRLAKNLFHDLSGGETAAAILLAAPTSVYRLGVFLARKAWAILTAGVDRMAPLYSANNFLDPKTGFKIMVIIEPK